VLARLRSNLEFSYRAWNGKLRVAAILEAAEAVIAVTS
jgi:hypothetical protein